MLHLVGVVEDQLKVVGRHNTAVAKSNAVEQVAKAEAAIQNMSKQQLANLYAVTGPVSDSSALQALPAATKKLATSTMTSPPAGRAAKAKPHEVSAPDCGSAPDPDAVHDAQLAISSAQALMAAIPPSLVEGVIALGEGAVTTVPDPAYAVAAGVLAAAQVVLDDLNYKIDKQAGCENDFHHALLINVANELTNGIANILAGIGDLSTLVDNRTNTIITQNKALQKLVDGRTTTIITQNKALQKLVDERTSTIIGQNDLQLKLDIQQNLTTRAAPESIATFELPASVGGYLDSTPIGVKEVVTDTLAQMQAAGERVSPHAKADLAKANAALAAHHYKDAYTLYQKSYQGMVK
ncbi:MAG: hypothetical protein ACRDP4_10840 [Nocardioidaceae bacterium]